MDEGGSEPGDVLREWERIVRRVRRHAPEALAGLDGPGDPVAIEAAQRRMGVVLPPELRAWLATSGLGRPRTDGGRNTLVAFGHDGVLPTGGLLLGLTDVERVHGFKQSLEESDPPDGDHVGWRGWWVPITAERDGFSGRFLDTRTGAVGAWSEGELPSEGLHPSLSAFLRAAADELEGVPAATGDGPDVRGRQGPDDGAVRAWARRNGHAVNDRGRIPSPSARPGRRRGPTADGPPPVVPAGQAATLVRTSDLPWQAAGPARFDHVRCLRRVLVSNSSSGRAGAGRRRADCASVERFPVRSAS
ncbi:hypothetical protein AB0442_03505 [Kitasatospora sp. NPDC085895]|uniref:Lsr2 family DNA-binding protein n=1 Tax=Kitasatospora sp. NPDC085895 TaxID=3155057 RepID=UPI00345098A4